MTDNRFKNFPVDARFPSPGIDVRFATPGVDARFRDGVDTRFEGDVYGGFDPIAALTPGAAVLAMWDASDLDTMFQDRAGSIPVTEPGQLVGVHRDKGTSGLHKVAVNDAARGTYQTDGVRHWIACDGINTGYVTPAVNPGVDKVQFWAGQGSRGLLTAILVEMSATAASNAGSFYVAAPESSSVRYSTAGRGNFGITAAVRADFATTPSNSDTAVITVTHDISGDLSTIQRNGVAGVNATGDKGLGNFGNYPIYFYRRGGTTLPLNGQSSIEILRFGDNLSPELLAQTNAFVGGKIGVML